AREPLPRFIIMGDKGMFVKYGMDVQEDALKAGRIPNDSPQWGVEPESVWGRINAEYKGMKITGSIESEKGDYSGFYKNMYDAIRNNAELIVKPAEARNTVRIIELAIQSNSERRTVNYS
ncbi:MAG TPA: Gfo/Idh/MocA family oxidoreductase, partial [Chitinophagaceae bacterium]|nr:Gfo/Idh/MocA family oxidoreductase [Chitinophagaceae bacterium]